MSIGRQDRAQDDAYWTPPGCKAVLLTLLEAMVTDPLVRLDEWKLLRDCLAMDSCRKRLAG